MSTAPKAGKRKNPYVLVTYEEAVALAQDEARSIWVKLGQGMNLPILLVTPLGSCWSPPLGPSAHLENRNSPPRTQNEPYLTNS